MKKTFTVLTIAFLFMSFIPNSSHAQFRLKLGPQLGLNYNIATGSGMENTYTGFGMLIGGTVDMSFTPMIGIITNLQFYDNRSVSFSGTEPYQGVDLNVDDSRSIAYFMIEPLFKLKLPNSGFYFVMGPAIGFNVEGSYTVKYSVPGYQTESEKGSLSDMLIRFELKAGAGYDIDLGAVYLTPQLSFGYGLTKVQSDNVTSSEARILTIQLLTAVKFSLL